jgi:hypothetical protein
MASARACAVKAGHGDRCAGKCKLQSRNLGGEDILSDLNVLTWPTCVRWYKDIDTQAERMRRHPNYIRAASLSAYKASGT